MKAMKGMKRSSSGSVPPMKKMKMMKVKSVKTKSPVQLKVSSVVKFLKDEEYCPIEGPESGRTMLIKMAPFVLGKGAASDQRADHQAKALADLEEVLRHALKTWFDKVKAAEDEVAHCEEKKAEAQTALESASAMLAKQEEEIEGKKAEVAEATKVEKDADKALRKATGKNKTSSEDLEIAGEYAKAAEAAKATTASLTASLKEAQAAKKTLAAAEKDAEKALTKTIKAVANQQGHLAVEQVGLEKVQGVFAQFKALRDRKHKRMPRTPKAESDAEGAPKSPRSPSILDRVASSILGFPKPEPTEES